MKINKSGIGGVVATILLVLLAVVASGILIGFFIRSTKNATSSDSSSCLGIDLKVNSCIIFPHTILQGYGLSDTSPAIFLNVERMPGRGDIKDLRFIVTDSSGNVHVEKPVNLTLGNAVIDTNYSNLVEYSTKDAIVRNLPYMSSFLGDVKVAVVVGETICEPTRPSVSCKLVGT